VYYRLTRTDFNGESETFAQVMVRCGESLAEVFVRLPAEFQVRNAMFPIHTFPPLINQKPAVKYAKPSIK